MSAIWGAYSNPGAGAIPVLEFALAALDPKIREQALEVLGATGSTQAIPAVRAALADRDLNVKYAATLSWVELAGESCFAELAGLLVTARGEERHALLRGFFHATNYMGLYIAIGPASDAIITALQAALADDLPQTRIAAASPLAWIRHPLAEQALLKGFQRESDGDVKAHMLTLAANYSSPVAGEMLHAALEDDDLLVRQTGEYLQELIQKGARP
jgi:HEAT repeat protein